MKLARALLWLSAGVFVAVGGGFLLVPREWAALTDISVPTAMARTDLRATYGGFSLGFGLYLAVCARRATGLRPGLVALALCAAGFALGRLLGIVAEGGASPLMQLYFGIDALVTLLALLALRRLPATGTP